jgi:hypothetical protein
VALAVKLSEAESATVAPVAAGLCDEHTGGVFFFTVQVRLTVLVPLVSVATNVLFPLFKSDDSKPSDVLVLLMGLPLRLQLVAQAEELGTTVKFETVEATEETVTVAVLGVLDVTEQSFCTLTLHEQVVLS